jgi:hypothetical protein
MIVMSQSSPLRAPLPGDNLAAKTCKAAGAHAATLFDERAAAHPSRQRGKK